MKQVTEEEFLEAVSLVRHFATESSLNGKSALVFRASDLHDAPDPFPVLGTITYEGPTTNPTREWFLSAYWERDGAPR